MGTIVVADNGKIDGETNTNETGGNNGTGSTSTNTTHTGTGTGTGGTGGTGGSGTGTTTKETIVSELAILNEDEQKQYAVADETERKRLIRNAKRRERYQSQKAENGQTVKPRKVRGKQAEQPKPAIDKTSLNMIIASLSSVIASRPNCEHWLLSEAEINSITEPLSKMLAESETFASMGQYSNQIALVMACVTIFVPRLIVTAQKQKEVKKVELTGQHTSTNVKQLDGGRNFTKTKNSNNKSTGQNERNTTTNGTNNVDNVPWYGNAISG